MKRIGFTEDNFRSVILEMKTQTRRLGVPKYKVGDIVAVLEPTQVLDIYDAGFPPATKVFYPWGNLTVDDLFISGASYQKLVSRSNWRKLAQSRFMLDDFARYFVEITEVRVQALQWISAVDAIAEGIDLNPDLDQDIYCAQGWKNYATGEYDLTPKQSFCTLWDSIHSAQNKRWDANPTVTAYTFEVKS